MISEAQFLRATGGLHLDRKPFENQGQGHGKRHNEEFLFQGCIMQYSFQGKSE